MNYDKRVKLFHQAFEREIREFPSLVYVFDSMFNFGFSHGAEWMREYTEDTHE